MNTATEAAIPNRSRNRAPVWKNLAPFLLGRRRLGVQIVKGPVSPRFGNSKGHDIKKTHDPCDICVHFVKPPEKREPETLDDEGKKGVRGAVSSLSSDHG